MPDDVAARMTIRLRDGQAAALEAACRRALAAARRWPWVRVVIRDGHLRPADDGTFVYELNEPAIVTALTEVECDRLVALEVAGVGGRALVVRSGWFDWRYFCARLRTFPLRNAEVRDA
jgi:hypothetical protein